MMMNGQLLVDNNMMSNLASASNNEATITTTTKSSSSKNRNEDGSSNDAAALQPPAKKKRNLPGNPDPEGEIIALSPRTLLATNRFVCEICHKGFQREQNLQLHRRGHNLPWKLKQRTNKEVKKKFYVCPEPSCVHHDPSRALGDLTGVKKHYCRKHGEKKWKCEKCSKRYAVQSDWKAHSKVCGTREYRCDCGTVFSRRDSFITHRAFCDALAQESARAVTPGSLLSAPQQPVGGAASNAASLFNFQSQGLQAFQLKREQDFHQQQQQQQGLNLEIPPWLVAPSPQPPPPPHHDLSSHLFATMRGPHDSPNSAAAPQPPPPQLPPPPAAFPSAHMSATALLQKAAEMGVTMSGKPSSQSDATTSFMRAHHQQATHMTAAAGGTSSGSAAAAAADHHHHHHHNHHHHEFNSGPLDLSAREQEMCLASFMNNRSNNNNNSKEQIIGSSPFLHNNNPSNGFVGRANAGPFDFQEAMAAQSAAAGSNNANDGLTRDFLGLTAFPHHRDFLNMAGLDQMGSTSSYDHHQSHDNHSPWQS